MSYLYNLGARKYAAISPKGEITLSDNPIAVTLETTNDGITIGNDDNTYAFIVNDYLNIEYMVSSVEPTFTEPATPNRYFTIDGQNISSPQKGLNIIRMQDGSTKKVWMK